MDKDWENYESVLNNICDGLVQNHFGLCNLVFGHRTHQISQHMQREVDMSPGCCAEQQISERARHFFWSAPKIDKHYETGITGFFWLTGTLRLIPTRATPFHSYCAGQWNEPFWGEEGGWGLSHIPLKCFSGSELSVFGVHQINSPLIHKALPSCISTNLHFSQK